MATYVNDLRLKEIATGDEAGTWGTSTNTNLQLIGEALGYGTQDCFASDADATTTVADGASDPARAMYFKVTSSATLTATRTLTIAPNTVSRVMLIENATTGSQSIAISQGSGGNVTIASGQTKMVYLDGAGATAAVVDALADLELGTITVANLTATTADINGGTIDGVTIGGSSAGAGTFTTLSATTGLSLADDIKATFGTSTELEIYYNSSATVNLIDSPSASIQMGANSIQLGSYGGSPYAVFDNTGVDVTGTVTADGLTVEGTNGNFEVATTGNSVNMTRAGNNFITASDAVGDLFLGAGGVSFVKIDNGGDISFYEDTGTTPKFFWDASAEALGIGTSSPVGKLSVAGDILAPTFNTNTTYTIGIQDAQANAFVNSKRGNLKLQASSGIAGANAMGGGDLTLAAGNSYASGSGLEGNVSIVAGYNLFNLSQTSGIITFKTKNAEAMRIDSSGNVGIGTSVPRGNLSLGFAGTGQVINKSLHFGYTTSDYYGYKIEHSQNPSSVAAGDLKIMRGTTSAWSEAARFDNSGNLLVGQSTSVNPGAGNTTVGAAVNGFGLASFSRDGNLAGTFNRNSSDGSLVGFYKDGSPVGSIGTVSGDIYIGQGDTNVVFNEGGDQIIPAGASGANRDAAVTLGASGVRFKDLYLSGGVYLGGTVSANKLDDYEEGTWTPVSGTNSTVNSIGSAFYTKVGRQVTVYAYITSLDIAAVSITLGGLPFTAVSGYGPATVYYGTGAATVFAGNSYVELSSTIINLTFSSTFTGAAVMVSATYFT